MSRTQGSSDADIFQTWHFARPTSGRPNNVRAEMTGRARRGERPVPIRHRRRLRRCHRAGHRGRLGDRQSVSPVGWSIRPRRRGPAVGSRQPEMT